MKEMKDLMGKALLDHFNGVTPVELITETNISEPDEFPVDHLFRSFREMPLPEQEALRLTKGKVLDAGCGAGSHTLYLQGRNIDVTALDTSSCSIEVARQRGVLKAVHGSIYELKAGSFDTILLLMNGTGILGRFAEASENLKRIAGLLSPSGQILIDSSNIIYMYDDDEDGGKWIPGDRYYGELDFTVSYKGETESFPWLYIDYYRLEELAEKAGLHCELVVEGDHYDYLARITPKR